MATFIYRNSLEFGMYNGRYICYLNITSYINIESLSINLENSNLSYN